MRQYGYALIILFMAGWPASASLSFSNYQSLERLASILPVSASLGVAITLLLMCCLVYLRPLLQCIVGCLLALLLCTFTFLRLFDTTSHQLPVSFEGIDLIVEGHVTGLPNVDNGNAKFLFHVHRMDTGLLANLDESHEQSVLLGETIRLSWRSAQELRPGQVWRFRVRLKRPRGSVNPQGFDYQAWLLRQGIMAVGYVKVSQNTLYIAEVTSEYISQWRFEFVRFCHTYTDNVRYMGIFKALLVGDKSDITSDQWWVFNDTGTVHLMAISGLHVGLITALVYVICQVLVRPLCFVVPFAVYRCLPMVASSAAAFMYAALAGFSLPTQRVLIVVMLLNVTKFWGIRCHVSWLLMIAAVTVTLIDPFSFLQPGFWLSFLAVFILIYVFGYRPGSLSKTTVLILTQATLFFGLLPAMGTLGAVISFVSPLANMLAVPVVSIIVLPFLFIWAFVSSLSVVNHSVSIFLLQCIDTVFHFLMQCLYQLQSMAVLLSLPLSVRYLVIAVILAVGLLLSPRFFRLHILCLILLLNVAYGYVRPKRGLSLTVLDVGQGLSAVLHMSAPAKAYTLVYDLGARYSKTFNMGERVVYPYLMSKNMQQVDTLIISHSDNDHAGGFNGFIKRIPVKRVLAGEPEEIKGYASDDGVTQCSHGMNVDVLPLAQAFPTLSLHVLWPRTHFANSTQVNGDNNKALNWQYDANNRSCVLLVNYGEKTLLFMGDVEAQVEKYLLNNNVLPKKIDVLIAGHHGSKTSSFEDFVSWVQPKVVIFSSGYKNRYHHPHPDVVRRYVAVGSRILNTASDGAIHISFDSGDALSIQLARGERMPLWFFD